MKTVKPDQWSLPIELLDGTPSGLHPSHSETYQRTVRETPLYNPNPMNNYMSDTQIAELDERIRRMTTSLAQLQAQRRGAIKAKFAFAKFVRDIDRKDTT
jgi:hypothetical protein|tara:strand:- start:171 stop:470 length:300 start_codon:yes stop_codon:yes gene_type:complete